MVDNIMSLAGESNRREISTMQTDIEVIKNELNNLKEGNREIIAKMDLIVSMQMEIVRLREQQDHTKQAMDRAFDVIRTAKESVVAVDLKVQIADGKINRAMSYVKGGAGVSAIAFGLLLGIGQWYLIQQAKQTEQLFGDFRAVDRRVLLLESRPMTTMPRGRSQ